MTSRLIMHLSLPSPPASQGGAATHGGPVWQVQSQPRCIHASRSPSVLSYSGGPYPGRKFATAWHCVLQGPPGTSGAYPSGHTQFSQPGEYRAAAESFVIFWPFSSLMTVESVFFSVYAHLYGRASLISAMSCVP